MKLNKTSPIQTSLRMLGVACAATALTLPMAHATPYASGITNSGGNISFILNEAGGNVTVVYDDGSTNASFNGVTTGTNQTAGVHSFPLAGHTNYTITVFKTGTGAPTLITNSFAFTPRGIDVNRHPASRNFGRVYTSATAGGIWVMNSDLSLALPSLRLGGIGWLSGNTYSPYRLSVADDDWVIAGDSSWTGGANTGIDGAYRLDPDISTGALLLGPAGEANGIGAGVHGTVMSRPIMIGSISNGPVTLMQIDADFPAAQGLNSILVYTNITLGALPWQNPPDLQGPEVGLNIASRTLGGNSYPGLQVGPNGYVYGSTYRNNLSNPLLQVYSYDPDAGSMVQIWNSYYNGNTKDYFLQTVGGFTQGIVDIAVSPDGRYVVGVSLDNWFVICPLTNGIPDTANLFVNTPTSFSGNARGVAFDAADNLYLSSSGLGFVQTWSLGLTTTAITTGDTNGSTSFQLILPSTQVSVAATTPLASQGGSGGIPGTPIPGVFTITRTNANNDYTSQVTVNFTLSGTATNGVYTVSPSAGITVAGAGSVVLPPGVISTNISIIPTTNNVPRLQTTAIITVLGGAAYSVTQPSAATVLIQNTSSNQLVISAAAATMYKAFAADFASLTVTRLGDTNIPSYTTTPFTYSGSAIPGVDFTTMPAVTWDPGDITHTPSISPLSNGVPPINVANPQYSGNKSIIVTLPSGPSYLVGAASTTLTLIDNANPTEPILFADPLTDPADANNWKITFGSGDEINHPSDYTVQFGYDLTINNPDSGNNGIIGLPPSGATNALRITCVKNDGVSYGGGVNVYYTNQVFGGNYAVRFNMNLIEGFSTFAVEGAMFGINHNGIETNWWLGNGSTSSGPWAADGIWYWIQSPPGGTGGFGFNDFQEYTGAGGALPNNGWTQLATTTASAQKNVYKRAVYSAPGTSTGGTPANNSPVGASPADDNWSDVEIKQINNVITMSVNKTPLFVYTNTTKFTNGYIMLGYDCPIQGSFNQYVGSPDASAYFSNLRVVSIGKPLITSISDGKSGNTNNVVITFVSYDGNDSASSFALQGVNQVTGPYVDVSASISQVYTNTGMAIFQATTSVTNIAQFYRIRHK